MTPVLETSTSEALTSRASETRAISLRQVSSPSGAHALAMELLAMMAWADPSASCSLSSQTGAALTRLVVNTPAAAQGTLETMSPRSFLSAGEVGLMPALSPAAEKPFAAQMPPGTCFIKISP